MKNFRESAEKHLKACIVLLEMAVAVGPGEIYGLGDVLSDFLQQTFRKKPEYEPEMVFVEGGSFTKGGVLYVNEKAINEVMVGNYYIGQYEVTQAQWSAVMGSNPSHFSGCDKCPVEQVSWNDVQEFLRRLNTLTGQRYRLPTEAEWEYAARGGNKCRGYLYSGSNNLDEVGWNRENSSKTIHPVGKKMPNELGLYDMSGNVWELCHDYPSSAQTNPEELLTGSGCVIRGGSWGNAPLDCRVTYCLNIVDPDDRFDSVGFRLAMTP